MGIFASRESRDIDVRDGEEIITFTIQKLSGRSLEKAKEAKAIGQAVPMRAYGGELVKALRSDSLEAAAKAIEAKKNAPEAKREARYNAYDRDTVLIAGVKRWSCQDRIPLSPDAIGDLDEPTCQTLHEAIIDLSLGPIDPEEAAEVPKGA